MQYAYTKKQNNTTRRILIACVIVVVVFVFDWATDGSVRWYARGAQTSVYQTFGSMTASVANASFFASKASLQKQNAELESQLKEYRDRDIQYAIQEHQNASLKQMTNLAKESQGVLAPILSSFRSSPYGTFLVGAGTIDGVLADDIVITPNGFVVGTITDVGEYRSLIKELFAPGTSVDTVYNDTIITLVGLGGENAQGILDQSKAINIGDLLMSQVYGGRPVGMVGHISTSTSALQNLYVVLPENIQTMQYVYVVHSAK